MTVGEKLSKHLGFNINDFEAVIQRSMNTSQPLYRVSVNSKYPKKRLLYSQLRKVDSVKTGYFSSDQDKYRTFKWTPPYDLIDYDNPIPSNSIIVFMDIAAEYLVDRNLYEAVSVNKTFRLRKLEEKELGQRLEEFTVYDLKSGILDDFRKPFAKERIRVKGTENKVAKLITAEIVNGRHVLFKLLTEPTFDFTVPVANPPQYPSNKTDTVYDMEIQLDMFIPWLEENELTFQNLTLKRFKEILQVVDVKVWCSCYAQNYTAHNWELSQVNASTRPTSIPPTVWSKRYKKNDWGVPGYGCKHLSNLFRQISVFESVMLGKLRELQK